MSPGITKEFWHKEAERQIRKWDDPGFLSPNTDVVHRQFRELLRAAAPIVNAVFKAGDEIPYRAQQFAHMLKKELEEESYHLDKFLNKKTLWNEDDFRNFLESLQEYGQEVKALYVQMAPYMTTTRLPLDEEKHLLESLDKVIQVELPAPKPQLPEYAEFEENQE